MSAPAGSYSNMGPRNTANQSYTTNPDVNMPAGQTGVTAGAPQNPTQAAAPGGNTFGTSGQGYNQTANPTMGRDYAAAGPGQTTASGGQTASCGEATGKSVGGVFRGIHGAGETIRGNVLSAIDHAVGNKQAGARNAEIAQAGTQEMRNGFTATSRPKQTRY